MIVAGLKKMSFQLLRNCLKWSDQSLRRNALRKKMTTASSGARTWCFGFILHWWTIWLNGQQGYLITMKSRVQPEFPWALLQERFRGSSGARTWCFSFLVIYHPAQWSARLPHHHEVAGFIQAFPNSSLRSFFKFFLQWPHFKKL